MTEESNNPKGIRQEETACSHEATATRPTRRKFLGQVGVAATVTAGTLAAPSLVAAQSSDDVKMAAAGLPLGVTNSRIIEAFNLRVGEAIQDTLVPPAVNVNNGDDARFADKGGSYTKGLPHDRFGRVDPNAYRLFKAAIASGRFSDYARIPQGGTRTQNGPQGALTFDLEALDSVQFGQPQVPPAPRIDGDVSANEMLEHYWAALLRDVAFTDYRTSTLAAEAAEELGRLPGYRGPRNSSGRVTTNLLFRGGFPGETLGPHISQFFIKPTSFGSQPLSQQFVTFVPDIDFMTDFNEWLDVQNGVNTGLQTTNDPQPRFMHNGRNLSAYTRVDVLYQAYFTAFLVLAGMGAPVNPGNPYIGSNQNGFNSFGGPDFAATQGEIATRALNKVWWQKWNVHLRPRPETMGGQIHLIKTGQGDKTDVKPSRVVLDSLGLRRSFDKYGTWLLSQSFPEGSPTHPAYPTGHGTVGGACITLLKFFFDGNFVLPNPMVPTSDGLSLVPYTGADAGRLTVNGELNKLGHNVSFGHGIHAGIHWRSDTDTSLLQGEAVALSFLRNRAKTYNEPFTVRLTKFDGTTATISNHGNP